MRTARLRGALCPAPHNAQPHDALHASCAVLNMAGVHKDSAEEAMWQGVLSVVRDVQNGAWRTGAWEGYDTEQLEALIMVLKGGQAATVEVRRAVQEAADAGQVCPAQAQFVVQGQENAERVLCEAHQVAMEYMFAAATGRSARRTTARLLQQERARALAARMH